jgi:MEDS: MEthanogen/methylotroph, DcmR Sensory domain
MEGMLDFYGAELRGVAEGRSGYDCIRTAGEMTWALRDIPGVGDLLTYEARVNQVMAANPQSLPHPAGGVPAAAEQLTPLR